MFCAVTEDGRPSRDAPSSALAPLLMIEGAMISIGKSPALGLDVAKTNGSVLVGQEAPAARRNLGGLAEKAWPGLDEYQNERWIWR